MTARTAGNLVGVHRNTAAYYFHRLRKTISKELEAENVPMFGGGIEVDESTLMPIIERKIVPDRIIHSDSLQGWNARDVSSFKYFRINHSDLFMDAQNHINCIERSSAHAQIQRCSKEHFGSFQKEYE